MPNNIVSGRCWRAPLLVGVAIAVALLLAASQVAAQPGSPPHVVQATLPFDDEVLAVAVQGDYAYVGLANGMAVLDIRQPLQPIVTGWTEGGAITIAFSGNYAYSSDNAGFRVTDISDPHHPVKLYDALFPVGIADLAAFGDYVYVATDFDLYVVNVRVPEAPEIVGIVYQRGIPRAVDVAPDPATGRVYAYLVGDFYPDPGVGDGGHGGGLRVIDVTNPTDPQEVWPCSNEDPCPGGDGEQDIVVAEGNAFIANNGLGGFVGLNIWDISRPEVPRLLAVHHTEDPAYRVAFADDLAYLITDTWGFDQLVVFDVADKDQPRFGGMTTVETILPAGLAALQGKGCLYAAQRTYGLRIICDTSVTPTPSPLVWLPLLTVAEK